MEFKCRRPTKYLKNISYIYSFTRSGHFWSYYFRMSHFEEKRNIQFSLLWFLCNVKLCIRNDLNEFSTNNNHLGNRQPSYVACRSITVFSVYSIVKNTHETNEREGTKKLRIRSLKVNMNYILNSTVSQKKCSPMFSGSMMSIILHIDVSTFNDSWILSKNIAESQRMNWSDFFLLFS